MPALSTPCAADWGRIAADVRLPADRLGDGRLDALLARSIAGDEPVVLTKRTADGRTALDARSAGSRTGWRSLLAVHGRVTTFEQAEELRLDYREFFDYAVELTAPSQRRAFLSADHERDQGRMMYTVEGQVADWRRGSSVDGDRHVYRICLMFPHAVNRDRSRIPLDSHLWLPLKGVGFPHMNRILPGNAHPDGLPLKIHLGDTLRVRGVLSSYAAGERGLRRLCLSEWTPLDSRLRYFQRYADGRMVERVVPVAVADCLAVAWVNTHSVLRRRDADWMDRCVALARERHPDVRSHRFVVDDPGRGYPAVLRSQRMTVSMSRGLGHVGVT